MNIEFLKKCWKHPRWHALMVLILWIISLTLLTGIVFLCNQFLPPKTLPIEKQVKEISYDAIWQNLLEANYHFLYTITSGEEKVEYTGNYENGKTSGYRENKDGILKYEIENNQCYELVMGERYPLETLYENDIYFQPSSLYALIKNIPEEDYDVIESTDISYIYTLEDKKITVYVTKENKIKRILIQEESKTYELDYTY